MSRPFKKRTRPLLIVLCLWLLGGVGGAAYAPVPAHETHVVLPGESLSSIARSHGVPEAQVAAANGLVGERVVYIGNQLRLAGPGFVAEASGPVHHRVQSVDTLKHIAAHEGVPVHELAHLNDVNVNAVFQPGAQIHLPGRSWVCPVQEARFFNDWGFPRSGGRYHTGTDLFAARGEPVRAPVSGSVTQVTGSAGGHQFELVGDDGNTYLGSHMDAFGASGRVSAGTIIGYVGDSGNALGSEPHLHFQIHPSGGIAVNPFPSLFENRC